MIKDIKEVSKEVKGEVASGVTTERRLIKNADLKRRIFGISYNHKLSHLGSCITSVDIIKEIYDTKKDDEKFVLSSGHAGLALYVVLESKGIGDAESMIIQGGIHPDRLTQPVDCSSGSLGHGLPIAVGMALADRSKNVYCLISDGECSEGSIFEAFRIAHEQKITNLKVYINVNGYGALKEIDRVDLVNQLSPYKVEKIFVYTNYDDFPILKGIDAHYHVLSETEYNNLMRSLS